VRLGAYARQVPAIDPFPILNWSSSGDPTFRAPAPSSGRPEHQQEQWDRFRKTVNEVSAHYRYAASILRRAHEIKHGRRSPAEALPPDCFHTFVPAVRPTPVVEISADLNHEKPVVATPVPGAEGGTLTVAAVYETEDAA
jgi:hypothetical protein